ncbi:MAG TPA: c-type cytochrome, partial [Steroidobacteraceae bacterium]|nr:c-type cytochrome [Steroidobacteraceae bacterium]
RCYSGSINTAGNLVFTGRNDGRFVAMNASNGDVLWEFQTGAGVNATATVFEHKGKEHVVIYTGGSLLGGAPPGDGVWLFSLDGKLDPVNPPAPPASARISMLGANAEAGRPLFAQYCSQCHGADGKGGHDTAPNITSIRNQQQVLFMLMNGRNSMPAIGNTMKPEEVRDVVEFVTRTMYVDPR